MTEPYSKNTLKSDQNLNPREQRSGSMYSIVCQTGPIVASCNEYLSLQGKKKKEKKGPIQSCEAMTYTKSKATSGWSLKRV